MVTRRGGSVKLALGCCHFSPIVIYYRSAPGSAQGGTHHPQSHFRGGCLVDTHTLLDTDRRTKAPLALAICLVVMLGAFVVASLIQRDFGRVEVRNVIYENYNSILVRAKLLRPVSATQDNPAPGIVYIHGYQNNRETSDAYCIELARRGFVVLNIDAIGRGNSGIPNDPDGPDFDETYGGQTSLAYLRDLPFVDATRTGMMGHSLGAEMAYAVALNDPTVNALVISGFAYTLDGSATSPKNMLMIIGRWDEYRERMTGTDDIEAEWMSTPQTRHVIPVQNPRLGVTYGDFAQGTARRVFVPRTIHIQESHNRAAIAEASTWMKSALGLEEQDWIDPHNQTWMVKEWDLSRYAGRVCRAATVGADPAAHRVIPLDSWICGWRVRLLEQ